MGTFLFEAPNALAATSTPLTSERHHEDEGLGIAADGIDTRRYLVYYIRHMANIIDQRSVVARQLFSTNFMKVLALFLRNPSGRYYGSEVARETGLSKAGANFALRDLCKAGFLAREVRGRLHFYALISTNPIVRQVKILNNIVELGLIVEELKKHSQKIVLYGSAATGENTEESDIDLLIITRKKEDIQKKIEKCKLEREIQPVIHTPQEWALLESENRVYAEQVARGIVLWVSDEA